MGLLDRFRKPSPPALPVELPPEALRDGEECHRTDRDVGHTTRGRGSAELLSVAGASHREAAVEAVVAAHGGRLVVTAINLPAVLLREPANPHDSNAIRVLVDGIHIGFMPAREAARFQPLLQECERRGVLLVGSVRLKGGDGQPWGAGLQVRPNLDGWQSQIQKKPAAKRTPPAKPLAVLLQGDDLDRVIQAVLRLVNQQPVRSKQQAGLVAKQVRELLPALESHADALEYIDEELGQALSDELPDLDLLEELQDASDADDREDVHSDLQAQLDAVHDALVAAQQRAAERPD